jgi:LytS/YehU family sensor histidine kinase
LGGFYFWNKQRKLKNIKEAAEMKQRLLRAQLNPHFLFNSLNSIQRLYVEGKTHLANDFIADFAQLMRDILEKTGRTKIQVYEEMDFIEAYLSLEKRRLGDKFDYEILLRDEIRNGDYNIPSFIVQPLVENALLHGILPKNERGKIVVKVETLSNTSLEISVTDNGVGFYSGKKNPNHKSKAMELIKNRLGKSGTLKIKELKEANGQVEGTEIKLILEY